jgi:gliding motility-associated-like protein
MFRNCCLWLLLFLSNVAFSQHPVFRWAKHIGNPTFSGSNGSGATSVNVDNQNNVYFAGTFRGTVDFDPGPGVYNLSTPNSYDQHTFISKLSPSGDFIWAIQFPLTGDVAMITDDQGNCYMTAGIGHLADMDPGPGVHNISPIGAQDAYVVKIDANGNFVWVRQFGGPGDTVPAGTALDLDKDGNIIVCGRFNNTVDFDPGPNQFEMSAVGTFEAFITKLSPNGDFIWARKLGNFNSKFDGLGIEDVKCDAQGNIYLTGAFKGPCDFDPGPNSFTLQSGGPADGYLCKLDKNGNFIFAKKFGNSVSNNVVHPRDICLDENSNVLIGGSFLGTQDFDPGPPVVNATSNGSYDAFILKFSANGDFIWIKNIGSSSVDGGMDIAVDLDNNVYTIGQYSGTVDFDPGPGVFTLMLVDGTVLTKLNPEGDFIYAAPFFGYSYGNSILIDSEQNILINGRFAGIVDFDPGSGVYNHSAGANRSEIFVLKLGKCLDPTKSMLTVNSCSNYTLNNKTYDVSGSYTQIIPNASGCDSIITLNLTINNKITLQTKTICEGEFFYAGGINQSSSGIFNDTLQTTLGCDSLVITTLIVNPKPIPNLANEKKLCAGSSLTLTPGVFNSYLWHDGSAGSTFTAFATGQYWVTVTNNLQCSATDTLTIDMIYPKPVDYLKPVDSICSYGTVLLRPLRSFSTYLWSTGAVSKNIEVNAPGDYWLQVRDANGCSGIDTVTVLPKQCMQGAYFPTAFTPNGDGKNDMFRPLLLGNVKMYRFTIYNRWGQVVFQSSSPQKGWDGKVAGVLQGNTVFVWTCTYELEGELVKSAKGTVHIIL